MWNKTVAWSQFELQLTCRTPRGRTGHSFQLGSLADSLAAVRRKMCFPALLHSVRSLARTFKSKTHSVTVPSFPTFPSFSFSIFCLSLSPSIFVCISCPWLEQLFAPEALWVCVAVAMPLVMPAVLFPDVNNMGPSMMKTSSIAVFFTGEFFSLCDCFWMYFLCVCVCVCVSDKKIER